MKPRSSFSITIIMLLIVIIASITESVSSSQEEFEILSQAIKKYEANDYPAALTGFTSVIEMKGNYLFQAYEYRGIIYYKTNDYQTAINEYSRALEIKPKTANCLCNRAKAYNMLKDYQAAIADYTSAIELDKTNADFFLNRANTYMSIENYDAAINDFTEYIKLSPNDANIYANRGYANIKLQKYADALCDLGKALSLDPNLSNTQDNWYYTMYAMGFIEKPVQDAIYTDEFKKLQTELSNSLEMKTTDTMDKLIMGFIEKNKQDTIFTDKYIKLQTELSNSLEMKTTDELEKLLSNYPYLIYFECPYKSTPLTYASLRGNAKIVEYLLDRGMPINANGGDGKNPLANAAVKGDIDMVNLLLKRGAVINSEIMYTVIRSGKKDMIDLLMMNGAKPTDIHTAAGMNDTAALEKYLSDMRLINATLGGYTPLMYAVSANAFDTFKILIEKGANVKLENTTNGITPLHLAAKNGNSEMVKVLIEKGADVNARTYFYYTKTKTEYDTPSIGQTLLDGAITGLASVLLGVGVKTPDRIKEKQVTVNKKILTESVLHYAVRSGNPKSVELLLNAGADVNVKGEFDRTPIMLAIVTNKLECLKIFINKSSKIKTDDKNKLLYQAAKIGKPDCIKFLIDIGADKDAKNSAGKRPYELLPAECDPKSRELLR